MAAGTVEIITGRERRRRWSVADKLRILAECEEPGAQVSAVAARHGIYRSLIFQWRRQARDGLLAAEPMPGFVPMRLEAPELPAPMAALPETPPPARRPASPRRSASLIEIELPDGVRLRIGEEVGSVALRRVLAALRG
jgi:transposase